MIVPESHRHYTYGGDVVMIIAWRRAAGRRMGGVSGCKAYTDQNSALRSDPYCETRAHVSMDYAATRTGVSSSTVERHGTTALETPGRLLDQPLHQPHA
jgi:hypothetical protein